MIKQNAEKILIEIKKAALDAGRSYDDIFLLPVVKKRTKQEIEELANCGLNVFSQNKAQELIENYNTKYGWHFIGQLQTNKVKDVVGKVLLIHSLDRLSLANEINKRACSLGIIQECLIQLNLGDDANRGGVVLGNDAFLFINSFLEQIKDFKNIKVRGFMCVLPITNDTETEKHYKTLQQIFASYQKSHGFDILSAGMSDDYKMAIKYGSTLIRIGSLFFK